MRRTVRRVVAHLALPLIALGLPTQVAAAQEPVIDQMPVKLEVRFALSALPPALRDKASVYVLDPQAGYQLVHQGSSGIACLVERTVWEMADFRNDIYIPLCYDAVGTGSYLKVIMEAAQLRIQSMDPVLLKAEIQHRYDNRTYDVPQRPGLSYMVAPVMRTVGPPDMQVHTMAMPHLMFYAPNITNADIGATPNLADHASLLYPFIDKQGIPEQSYMIQLLGDAEKTRILSDEKELIADLCAYRDVLCLPDMGQPQMDMKTMAP